KEIMEYIYDLGGLVFIVSGGFRENINVVADTLGVSREFVFGNDFKKENKKIVGFDEKNILTNSNGKVEVAKQIKNEYKDKKIICIGDGNSDYLMKKEKIVDEFFGFWRDVERENLMREANQNFFTSEELLRFLKVSFY
ncbi:MAG: haloacid dehalogenase-like hydrolase, partial [Patescibacteria group bacterium]